MKAYRTILKTFLLLTACVTAFFMAGCESSSVVTRPLSVPPRLQSRVTVAPIAPPSKLLVGVKSTTTINDGIVGSPIVVGFTWKQQDCENLRQSIASSIGAPSGAQAGGYTLQVQLAEAGITRMDVPTCKIVGTVVLKKGLSTIATQPIHISATVFTAVSAAKDKAIRELLAQIEVMLQSSGG